MSEVKASILYSLEPVFEGIIAFLYLGEKLPPRAIAGGALIFTGMVFADLKRGSKSF